MSNLAKELVIYHRETAARLTADQSAIYPQQVASHNKTAELIEKQENLINKFEDDNKRLSECSYRKSEVINQLKDLLTAYDKKAQELEAHIEYLKSELKSPIEPHFNDACQCNFICNYCGEELGSKHTDRELHLKSCEKIPANRAPSLSLHEVKSKAIQDAANTLCTTANDYYGERSMCSKEELFEYAERLK